MVPQKLQKNCKGRKKWVVGEGRDQEEGKYVGVVSMNDIESLSIHVT